MIGGIIGLIVGVICILSMDTSWWWLFAWFFGGVFLELCARLGCGQEVADAVGDLLPDLLSSSMMSSDMSSGGGDYGGGDYGGGGDCGGGDSGGGGGCD